MIIDTNLRTTNKLACLKQSGVTAIIRYYARTTKQPQKRLTKAEAAAILDAGLRIGIVHQAAGDHAGYFSSATGLQDGAYARHYGAQEIGQPGGSAIYFAVDYDASADDVTDKIIPYFRAVAQAFVPTPGEPDYDIGVYGSGLVCRTLLDLKLATYTWISQSSGFNGTQQFKKSKRWTLLQQLPSLVCDLDVDVDELNGEQFGAFDRLDDPDATPANVPLASAQTPAAGGAAFDENAFVEFVRSLDLKHFKPYELLMMGDRNADAQSPCFGLNTPPPRALWTNIAPTIKILDQLRDRFGAPIRILSAYRSPAYNKCIGGARESQHSAFRAIDFHVEGQSRPADWARVLRALRDGEGAFKGGVGLYSNFVHLDTRGNNADW